MIMGVARDIALVFLSLEALIIVLIPLILIGALTYGVYRLRLLVREYLRLALGYAQQANDAVKSTAKEITDRFISIYTGAAKVSRILNRLFLGGFREF
jgi:hypothetical protein